MIGRKRVATRPCGPCPAICRVRPCCSTTRANLCNTMAFWLAMASSPPSHPGEFRCCLFPLVPLLPPLSSPTKTNEEGNAKYRVDSGYGLHHSVVNGKGNFCPPNDASPRRVKTRQGTSPPAEDRASCRAAPPPFPPFLCFDGDGFSFHFGRFSFCHPAAPCAPPPTAQRPVPAFWIPRPRPPFTRRRGKGGRVGVRKKGAREGEGSGGVFGALH